jgi:tetratricopeptide (TPR) repeat protein
MKPISRAILVCLLPLAVLRAQETAKPTPEPRPHEQAFLNLPQDTRNKFGEKLLEAQRLYGQKRVFEAMAMVNEASAIFADSPDLLNLRGACEVEFRNFEKAMESFKKANELNPGQPLVFFNVAELYFVTKDWKNAEASLTTLLEMIAKDSATNNFQLARLVEFKLLLSKIKLGKKDEAAKMAVKYDYLDDSPYPYYAEAAMHYLENREIEAEAAMARAGRIFQSPDMLNPWQDTMIEFGYIKGFFGGEADAKAGQ